MPNVFNSRMGLSLNFLIISTELRGGKSFNPLKNNTTKTKIWLTVLWMTAMRSQSQTYLNVPTGGEGGKNEQKAQTQNHNVETPSVSHGFVCPARPHKTHLTFKVALSCKKKKSKRESRTDPWNSRTDPSQQSWLF